MEAFEGYWRKMPSVKRLVYKKRPRGHHAARHAQARRGGHCLPARRHAGEEIKRDPTLKLAFSGAIGTFISIS